MKSAVQQNKKYVECGVVGVDVGSSVPIGGLTENVLYVFRKYSSGRRRCIEKQFS